MAVQANFDGVWKDLKVKTSDTLPIGTQVAYGGSTPPTGWLICDGSAVSRTVYADLFKVIGTSYGAGDGSTTFNLPNKKGRVSAGYDSSNANFNAIGKHLGEETHTLTLAELPQNIYLPYGQAGTTGKSAISNSVIFTNSDYQGQAIFTCGGNGASHNNIQPTEVDNWIIKAFQSIGVVANVAKVKTNSDNDVYSCNYVNQKTEGIIGWENPDITEAFESKNIILSTNDYNYYEIIWKTATTDNTVQIAKGIKGYGTNMSYMNTPITAESMYRLGTRQLNYIDDTHYSFSAGYYRYVINNEACIPIKIILYK